MDLFRSWFCCVGVHTYPATLRSVLMFCMPGGDPIAGVHDQALADAETSIRLDGQAPHLWEAKGVVHTAMGRPGAAHACLSRALQLRHGQKRRSTSRSAMRSISGAAKCWSSLRGENNRSDCGGRARPHSASAASLSPLLHDSITENEIGNSSVDEIEAAARQAELALTDALMTAMSHLCSVQGQAVVELRKADVWHWWLRVLSRDQRSWPAQAQTQLAALETEEATLRRRLKTAPATRKPCGGDSGGKTEDKAIAAGEGGGGREEKGFQGQQAARQRLALISQRPKALRSRFAEAREHLTVSCGPYSHTMHPAPSAHHDVSELHPELLQVPALLELLERLQLDAGDALAYFNAAVLGRSLEATLICVDGAPQPGHALLAAWTEFLADAAFQFRKGGTQQAEHDRKVGAIARVVVASQGWIESAVSNTSWAGESAAQRLAPRAQLEAGLLGLRHAIAQYRACLRKHVGHCERIRLTLCLGRSQQAMGVAMLRRVWGSVDDNPRKCREQNVMEAVHWLRKALEIFARHRLSPRTFTLEDPENPAPDRQTGPHEWATCCANLALACRAQAEVEQTRSQFESAAEAAARIAVLFREMDTGEFLSSTLCSNVCALQSLT